MFGISFLEIVVVLVIALLVFGPEKLPGIARTLGKVTGELRRNADALRREFYNSVYTPFTDEGNPRQKRTLESSRATSLPQSSEKQPSGEEHQAAAQPTVTKDQQ